MNWNDHSKIKGSHSFLSASQHSWLNYDEKKLVDRFMTAQAAAKGTRLHAFAAECIELKQKLPKSRKTLNMYVNDAIGYHMSPEVVLYYSENCFGTADAIRYYEKEQLLRVHDLKTGVSKVSMDQLRIYNAMFCLEYNIKPGRIHIENRIYQSDEIIVDEPDTEDIAHIMDLIIHFDKILEHIKLKEDIA